MQQLGSSRGCAAAEQLGEHPHMGHVGSAAGTLEWVVTGLPYVIVYEVHEANDEIVVLGIYHGAQLRPGQRTFDL